MPLIRGVLVLAAALAGIALFAMRRSHHGPLDRGIWYWHSPFRVSPEEGTLLREAGIGTIYVRAGTFTSDGKRILLRLPQQWESSPDGFQLVAVFSFDPGAVRHFDEIPVASFEQDVASAVKRAIERAHEAGVDLHGVQLDFDCPTRLLSRYSEVVAKLRGQIRETFSVTALPTWITASAFRRLAENVDFVVPQFYEGRVDRTFSGMKPIGDLHGLRTGLEALDRLGVSYRVGLPAYGHALLFDDRGRLASMYRDLSAEDALRHPALEFKSYAPYDEKGAYVGEDLLRLQAVRGGRNGNGLGWNIVYDLPSPEMVIQQSGLVDQQGGSKCLGTIYYRFPEANETTCLPLKSLAAALTGQPLEIGFDLQVKCRALPYALIGGKAAKVVPREVTIEVTSNGNSPTAASPTAFRALVEFDGPGLGEVFLGDFDEVRIGTVEGGKLVPCGRARATALEFRRFHILPGQKLRSGAIELTADGPTNVSLSCTAEAMGHRHDVQGTSPTRKLAELTK